MNVFRNVDSPGMIMFTVKTNVRSVTEARVICNSGAVPVPALQGVARDLTPIRLNDLMKQSRKYVWREGIAS